MSEWAKQQACWNGMKGRYLDYDDDFSSCLTLFENAVDKEKEEKARKKLTDGINAQTEVVTLGAALWASMLEWGQTGRKLTPKDQQILKVCASIPRQVPSEWQAQHALEVRQRLRDQGYEP
ncbi:MAG: hypothetical protein ABI832_08645 [bacterium]